MAPLFFCNIGWMAHYYGQEGRADRIEGGGSYVVEHGRGGEVCNFLPADDGYVYGHVETFGKEADKSIHLEALGCKGLSIGGVDVVWTAKHPREGGRRVIGWYRNATIFRARQEFPKYPSKQHRLDQLGSYRIRAKKEDAHLLAEDDRELRLGHGPGWMGKTPWWTPKQDAPDAVRKFVRKVRATLKNGTAEKPAGKPTSKLSLTRNTASAPGDPFVRYVQYEVEVGPRHDKLQKQFTAFLETCSDVNAIAPDRGHVDVQYRHEQLGHILTEVKPCDRNNARYAIRLAIGQLLDYQQRMSPEAKLLIVLQVKPDESDLKLAVSNGFGLAFPRGDGFVIEWPKVPSGARPSEKHIRSPRNESELIPI
jgi:hypothetical protein